MIKGFQFITTNYEFLLRAIQHYSNKIDSLDKDEDLDQVRSELLKQTLEKEKGILKFIDNMLTNQEINDINSKFNFYRTFVCRALECYKNDLIDSNKIIKEKFGISTPKLDMQDEIDKAGEALSELWNGDA